MGDGSTLDATGALDLFDTAAVAGRTIGLGRGRATFNLMSGSETFTLTFGIGNTRHWQRDDLLGGPLT